MMINFSVPLSLTVSAGVLHAGMERFRFCCNFQPIEGEGQATTAVLVVVRKIRNVGALADWSA